MTNWIIGRWISQTPADTYRWSRVQQYVRWAIKNNCHTIHFPSADIGARGTGHCYEFSEIFTKDSLDIRTCRENIIYPFEFEITGSQNSRLQVTRHPPTPSQVEYIAWSCTVNRGVMSRITGLEFARISPDEIVLAAINQPPHERYKRI